MQPARIIRSSILGGSHGSYDTIPAVLAGSAPLEAMMIFSRSIFGHPELRNLKKGNIGI
jgi:hypothetical protein